MAMPGPPVQPIGGPCHSFTGQPGGDSREEFTMRIWHDLWPELSVLLVLFAMAGGLALTFILTR